MKQNKYFSLKRFFLLLRNDWLIHRKTYLFTVLGMTIGIYVITYLPMTRGRFLVSDYNLMMIFTLMGVGVFIGNAFPVLKNQIKTTNYLLAPGSTFEKLMVQFVIRVVIFIPLSLILFWIAVNLAKASLIPDPTTGFDPAINIPDFHFSGLRDLLYYKDVLPTILGIFSYYTFLFAGSVYFHRYVLAKTIILTGAILFSLYLSFLLFSHLVFPAETQGYNVYFKVYNITEDIDNIKLFLYILASFSWLFFLPLTYFKLKEKEV